MLASSFTPISLTLKALCSSYLLSAVSILDLCHCLAFPFPFLTHLLPTGYRRLTFPKLSVDTFLRERRSKKAPSKTAITAGRNLGSYLVLVTVWISGSLLQFVITSWALKHCPNMFCCESTDPVWHYFKERGQWSSLLITVIRNRGGGLRHL